MKRTRHSIENLMALLLFGVFAASMLSVLLTGAGVYQRFIQRNERVYQARTGVQYLATRVRQADCLDGVAVEKFGDHDCLSFTERIQGHDYITRIYCYDGFLMELFTEADASFSPSSGEPILEVDDLQLTLLDGLLTAVICDDAGTQELILSLRSGEVGE